MAKKKRGGDSNRQFQRQLPKHHHSKKKPHHHAAFFAQKHEEYVAKTQPTKPFIPDSPLSLNVVALLKQHPQLLPLVLPMFFTTTKCESELTLPTSSTAVIPSPC